MLEENMNFLDNKGDKKISYPAFWAVQAGCNIEQVGRNWLHANNCPRCAEVEGSLFLQNKILGEKSFQKLVNAFVPVWKEGKRNFLTLGLCGALAKAGYAQEDVKKLISQICLSAGDRERRHRLYTVRRTFRILEAGIKAPENLAGISIVHKILKGD